MSATVSILGNLGNTPEMGFTPDGNLAVNFSIASNTIRNSPQGRLKETNWFRVTAYGNQAKTLVQYAKKGTRLLVEGKLIYNPWLNRENVPQVGADVTLQDFQFVGGREKDEADEGTSTGENTEFSVETEFTADIQEFSDQTLSY